MNEKLLNEVDEFKKMQKIKEMEENQIISELEQNEDFDALANRGYEYLLKDDKNNAIKCVRILINAYKEKKVIPYAMTCYLAGEISFINKKYEIAKKDFYLAAKYGKTEDIGWIEKSRLRLEEVCLRTGSLEQMEGIFRDYKNGKSVFVEKNTNKVYSFKIDELLMWDVMPKDLVMLNICRVDEKRTLITQVQVVKKAREVEEDKFLLELKKEIQKEQTPIAKKQLEVYEGELPYIFVSYSHKENEVVLPIIEKLQNCGFRVWFDQGIEVGSEWPQYIGEHVAKCDSMLVCMSPNAEESHNCRSEINMAAARKKNIIVLYLEDFTINDYGLELLLSIRQAIYKSRHNTLDSLVKALTVAKLLQKCR